MTGKGWKKFWLGSALLAGLVLPWAGPAALPADAPVQMEQMEEPCPKLAAITFDDGPRRTTTTKLLDGLARRGVKCTFFIIGEQVEGNEDILRRMDAEGHQLGLHTFDHVSLVGLNAADFSCQVDRSREAIKRVVGHNDFVLRPPYGQTDPGVEKRAGCPIILWSVDPTDWDDRNTARIVKHVVEKAGDGDIILLHDIYDTSVEAALQIVDALHEKGFLLVTVDELASQRQVELEPGKIYRGFWP